MDKTRMGWMAASALLGLLAWDNWQLREELARLHEVAAAPALVRNAIAGEQAAVPRGDCPAVPVAVAECRSLPSTPAVETKNASNHSTSSVEIPPGTDLLEAIKIIQREQAKSQPGSAAVSPFSKSQ